MMSNQSQEDKTIRMNITIAPKHREYLRKEAFLADKNMSWVVRKMIDEKIKKKQ